jgi:hypothetical protein
VEIREPGRRRNHLPRRRQIVKNPMSRLSKWTPLSLPLRHAVPAQPGHALTSPAQPGRAMPRHGRPMLAARRSLIKEDEYVERN